ncbi:MAG: sodium:proton antiporter, partial [Proteobacteria bacterium]
LAKKTQIPYPVLLAFAGMCIGALPNSPAVKIEPHLALAIFVSPAIFDAAFDTSRHQLRKNWLPLFSLVVCAVLLTTAAVAYVGVAFAGLPLAAAIALGAIVAPPDAAAVKEVTREAKLPQNTAVVLQGESLLNDAVAIMIYGVAVDIATQGDSISQALPRYLFSFPGALIFGWVVARGYMLVRPIVTKSLSAILLEFGSVFAVWIAAEHLHLSSILAVVVYAFTIAKYVPEKQGARDRIYSYSVWEAVVFLLNVSAFLILGLHAKSLLERIRGDELVRGLEFAGLVLLTVIVVRVVWVLAFTKFERMTIGGPSKRISFVVSWCGVRGLVTLATAFALPGNFPQRDLLALTAFTVVLGTMIIQGTTLIPLIKFLKLEEEHDPSES